MAKKTTTRGGSSRSSLGSLRTKIDRLDKEIVANLNQRAKLAVEIGKLKSKNQEQVYAPDREEEVLQRVVQTSRGPLGEACIRSIFREIISGSRALEKMLRVAYLGPEYSYSHLASVQRFGQGVEMVQVNSIPSVFEEVNRGHADYGMVPLENSTDGRIADTLDMFARLRVRICGEVQMRIHHFLLSGGERSAVREIYSRPQALSQCRNWLAKHMPGARTIEVTSTSTAAQLARDKPGAAAVASRQAGTHYGLNVLAEHIEDNPANLTRFAVIGQDPVKRTSKDKTAVMFQIEHKPGSLADAMGIFKRNRLNLTWIESFPTSGPQGSYLFFVEMEGHENDQRIKRAIASLERKAVRLEVLGSYAASPPVE